MTKFYILPNYNRFSQFHFLYKKMSMYQFLDFEAFKHYDLL